VGLDFTLDWDPLQDEYMQFSTPIIQPNQVFPPSPVTSRDSQSPQMEDLSLEEYIRRAGKQDLDLFTTLSNETATATLPLNSPSLPYSTCTSPSETIKPEPLTPTSQKAELQTPLSFTDGSALPPRRRGPGRPSKAQQLLEGKKPSARVLMTMRRQFHNDSATRSRARFNNCLIELWNEVPESEKTHLSVGNDDPGRQVCRAEKIETVISYLRKLQRTLQIHGLRVED
jgi:hypothetical protein